MEVLAIFIGSIVSIIAFAWNIFVGFVGLSIMLVIGIAIGLKGTSRPPVSKSDDLPQRLRDILSSGDVDAEVARINRRNDSRTRA